MERGATALSDELALTVERVSVHYGKFVAVHEASFEVRAGECAALIGPNGHGKSSLVAGLAGLAEREGEVRVFGDALPASKPAAAVAHGLVLVPERRHLYPALSVRDNILLGAYHKTTRVLASRAWADVSDVLEVFPELAGRLGQRAGTLSGGQQQMVTLARALASRPRVMLLDEPCLGLAETVAERVYEVLARLKAMGVTMLLVEENPIRALEVSERVIKMDNGVASALAATDIAAMAPPGK